jgi:hypothetical protein
MGCPFCLGCGAAESVSSSSLWMVDSVCGGDGFVVRCVVRFDVRYGGSANELAGWAMSEPKIFAGKGAM